MQCFRTEPFRDGRDEMGPMKRFLNATGEWDEATHLRLVKENQIYET